MQPRVYHPPVAKLWLFVSAALSLAAAIIHMVAAQLYFPLWAGYGFFFVAAATTQLALAILLWVYPSLWDDRPRRGLLLAGVLGNVLIVAMWLITRTVGVPAGPNAGEVLPLSLLDLLAVIAEIGVIVAVLMLVALYSRQRRTSQPRNERTG